MNFVALVLAAAVTTAQLGNLRDSSAVVTGVDAGAFLASSNNVVAAGKTNALFSGSGIVKASGVTLAVDGGGVSLSPSTSVSAAGPVYFPTNAMPDSGAAGWESLDQRMARRLYGAFYYGVDSDGNPTAVTLGSRYLPLTYPVGPYSFAFDGNAAGGARSFAGGSQSRATAFGAFAYGSATLASAEGAVAMGSHAEATNQYSFVWQGFAPGVVPFGSSAYGSHGDGSFSIWPKDGVNGFWIGSQTLAQYVTSRVSSFVDASAPFTYRSVLFDNGVQFGTSGGHNSVTFTPDTVLSVQNGAKLTVSNASDVTVGGIPLDTWVSSHAVPVDAPSLEDATNYVDAVASVLYADAARKADKYRYEAGADANTLVAYDWWHTGESRLLAMQEPVPAEGRDEWWFAPNRLAFSPGSDHPILGGTSYCLSYDADVGWVYMTLASGNPVEVITNFQSHAATTLDFVDFELVRTNEVWAAGTNRYPVVYADDLASALEGVDGTPDNMVVLVPAETNVSLGVIYRLKTKDGGSVPYIPSTSGKFVTQPGCTTDYLADGSYYGGVRVVASSVTPENSYTAYAYNGVSVKRNGGATKNYTYDESSNGIARRGDVDEVKAKFYDEPLEVEWTFKAVNGEFMMIATTNVNTGVLAP